MPRKSSELRPIMTRLPEDLRKRLEREAGKAGHSMNREIINRLWSSFDSEHPRRLDEITRDLEAIWLKYGERFLLLDLQEETAEALEKGDLKAAQIAARAWLQTRKLSQSRAGRRS